METKNLEVIASKEWTEICGEASRLKVITSWAESVASAVSAVGLAVKVEAKFERGCEYIFAQVEGNDGGGPTTWWETSIDGMTDLEAVIKLSSSLERRLSCIEKLRPESHNKIRHRYVTGLKLKSRNEKALITIREHLLNARIGDHLSVGRIGEVPGGANLPRPNPTLYQLGIVNNYPDIMSNWEAFGETLLQGQFIVANEWHVKV